MNWTQIIDLIPTLSLLHCFSSTLHFLHLSDYVKISFLLLLHFLIYNQINDSPTFLVCFKLLQEVVSFHHKYICFVTDASNAHGVFARVRRSLLCHVFFSEDLSAADESDSKGFNLKTIGWLLGTHDTFWCHGLIAVRTLWVAWLVFYTVAQELGKI